MEYCECENSQIFRLEDDGYFVCDGCGKRYRPISEELRAFLEACTCHFNIYIIRTNPGDKAPIIARVGEVEFCSN